MGLKLRLNLFHRTTAERVYAAYEEFYSSLGQRLVAQGGDQHQFDLYAEDNGWTVLNLDGGWEWSVRREAQLSVSTSLRCSGLLVFVYGGDYWGYECFREGKGLDHFVQEEEPADGSSWFPGKPCAGNAAVIAHEFGLDQRAVSGYLVRDPVWAVWDTDPDTEAAEDEWRRRRLEQRELDVPVRDGDEFSRFDECAVLDFLRLLGVRVGLINQYVTFQSPLYRRFWIEGQNTASSWQRRYGRRRK